jgi:hypothetical protein
MRRLKRSTALLQRSGNCLRGCRESLNEDDFARTKSRALVRLFQMSAPASKWRYSVPVGEIPEVDSISAVAAVSVAPRAYAGNTTTATIRCQFFSRVAVV